MKRVVAGLYCLMSLLFLAVPCGAQELLQSPPQFGVLGREKLKLIWDKDPQYSPGLTLKGGDYYVAARLAFEIDDPAKVPALVLEMDPPLWGLRVNGKDFQLPLPKMRYNKVSDIPGSMLKPGANVIEPYWEIRVKDGQQKDAVLKASLRPRTDDDIKLTGPILAHPTATSMNITCRTNVPMDVLLEMGDRRLNSNGYNHKFLLENLSPGQAYTYTIKATLPGGGKSITAGPYTFHQLPPEGTPLRFAMVSDTQRYPERWVKVAARMQAENPMFILHGGDLVDQGLEDHRWDEELWAPAKELFATVPTFAVIGNHEKNCPILRELFPTPDGKQNWIQRVGPLEMVGIDFGDKWEVKSDQYQWLKAAIKQPTTPYNFVISHCPPYSTDGKGAHQHMATALVVFPLVQQCQVTAFLCGHHHVYARFEPPNTRTSVVIAGGAGGGLGDSVYANPPAQAHQKVHHYLVFTADAKEMTMTAKDWDGKVMDTRTWPAREIAK